MQQVGMTVSSMGWLKGCENDAELIKAYSYAYTCLLHASISPSKARGLLMLTHQHLTLYNTHPSILYTAPTHHVSLTSVSNTN